MPLSLKQIATLASRDKKVAAALTGRVAGATFRQIANRTKLEPNHLRGACRRLIAAKKIVMQGNSRAARYFDQASNPEKAAIRAKPIAKPIAKRTAGKTMKAGATIKGRRSGGMKRVKRAK